MPRSTFLDGRAVTQLRGLAFLSLSETGHRLASSVSDDAGGGGTMVFTQSGTVSCRIDRISGSERESAGRLSDRSTHVLSVPAGTTLGVENRWVIDGRGTFEVTAEREHTRESIERFEVVAL